MKISVRVLLTGALWTLGAYGAGQALRLAANIVLARLLAPDLFGVMLIVYSFRTGIELISDVGFGQNIVYNENANDPNFYNTAWTLRLIRGIILWLVTAALAVPIARLYQLPILAQVVPVAALYFIFTGLSSTSRLLLQKRLQIARLNIYDIIITFINAAATLLIAYFYPTIWALVLGGLCGSLADVIGSYLLLPGIRHRFFISKQFAWQILHFGKWIFLSSIVYFLSTNFDRLYLPRHIPLELVGVYGIARSLSELVVTTVLQLGSIVLFPFIASHSQIPRAELRGRLISIRASFFLLAAFGLSLFAATADIAIKIVYDQRYQAAGWILPILIIGSWFSIIANVNESTLLGLGKPSYGAISNSLKFAFLLIGVPLGVKLYGLIGVIVIVASSDLCRYIPIFIGQRRGELSFGRQDIFTTLGMFLLLGFWEWIRWLAGLGTSFGAFPM
jgi:O-antigen/teichoic acid export membrane protein